MPDDMNIENIVANRKTFNDFVYTPLEEAIEELHRRWEDKDLENKIHTYLKGDIPEPLSEGFKAVIFRQLITPNYELRRFMSVPDATRLKPIFWEYAEDKFTSHNPLKQYLGKMSIHSGIGKKGGAKIEYQKIIDFNSSNGKRINEVQTVWKQDLVDFHHELLDSVFPNSKEYIFDSSSWLQKDNETAKDYYSRYVALFVRNAILFENFILEGHELDFTKEVFLPAFIKIMEITKKKPLVVALEPTDIEGDLFWMCHPPETKILLENKFKLV